jgi:hypothetical protein
VLLIPCCRKLFLSSCGCATGDVAEFRAEIDARGANVGKKEAMFWECVSAGAVL